MTVAGVLLAAGAGTRFGGPKALVRLHGELLVHRGVRLLREGGCDRVLVVLGAQAERVRAELRDHLDRGDVDAVVAEDWATGMGASLRAGLAALPSDAGACVVALADQPLVAPEAVRRLVTAWTGGATAAVASYDGRARNPVLLDRAVWPEVSAAAVGDTGARGWLATHPDRVVAVECGDTGSPYDVDVPADLDVVAGWQPGPRPTRPRSVPA